MLFRSKPPLAGLRHVRPVRPGGSPTWYRMRRGTSGWETFLKDGRHGSLYTKAGVLIGSCGWVRKAVGRGRAWPCDRPRVVFVQRFAESVGWMRPRHGRPPAHTHCCGSPSLGMVCQERRRSVHVPGVFAGYCRFSHLMTTIPINPNPPIQTAPGTGTTVMSAGAWTTRKP